MIKFTPKSCFFMKKSLQNQFFFYRKSFRIRSPEDETYEQVVSGVTVNVNDWSMKALTAMKVEEKFGEQNFRVLSEMRGENLYIDPKKLKFRVKIRSKCRIRLCQNLKSAPQNLKLDCDLEFSFPKPIF